MRLMQQFNVAEGAVARPIRTVLLERDRLAAPFGDWIIMNGKATYPRALARSALALAMTASALTFALPAAAGCSPGIPNLPGKDAPAPRSDRGLMSVTYRGSEGAFLRVDDRDQDARAGIVGTWRFTWTSDGTAYPFPIPSGAVVDFGTQQWHDDGTEFIISGARPRDRATPAWAVGSKPAHGRTALSTSP